MALFSGEALYIYFRMGVGSLFQGLCQDGFGDNKILETISMYLRSCLGLTLEGSRRGSEEYPSLHQPCLLASWPH